MNLWTSIDYHFECVACRYFKAHPEYQSKFKAFAKVPMDELKDNRSFQVIPASPLNEFQLSNDIDLIWHWISMTQMHAMNVMNAITLIVDTLENPEELVSGLKEMGVNHRKRRIEAIHFHVSNRRWVNNKRTKRKRKSRSTMKTKGLLMKDAVYLSRYEVIDR